MLTAVAVQLIIIAFLFPPGAGWHIEPGFEVARKHGFVVITTTLGNMQNRLMRVHAQQAGGFLQPYSCYEFERCFSRHTPEYAGEMELRKMREEGQLVEGEWFIEVVFDKVYHPVDTGCIFVGKCCQRLRFYRNLMGWATFSNIFCN